MNASRHFLRQRKGPLRGLLLDDVPEKSFHHDGVNIPWKEQHAILVCQQFQSRLIAELPATHKEQTWRVPFLIDTGAPDSYMHRKTLEAIGVKYDNVQDTVRVNVCGVETNVKPHDAKGKARLAYINILGMDFLMVKTSLSGKSFITTMRDHMDAHFHGQTVVVTDGTTTFRVSPKYPQVMDLKLAIKEYGMYALHTTMITASNSTRRNHTGRRGRCMG